MNPDSAGFYKSYVILFPALRFAIKNISLDRLAWIIIFAGIILRLSQYLANRSLWLDESFITLNIVQKSFLQLFQPLDFGQVAPPGFLILEKLAIQVLGNNEYALRLFPLISGILALFLFYKLAPWYIAPAATIVGLGLLSIAEPLIYYSSEVKQYSSDVAIALILYLVTIRICEQQKLTFGTTAMFVLVGSVAIWFSHPAVFVLSGIGSSLILASLRTKNSMKAGQFASICFLWLCSFAAFYFSVIHKDSTNVASLSDSWGRGPTGGAFVPAVPILNITWFINAFADTLTAPTNLSPALAALPFIIGCVSVCRQRIEKFLLLTLPLLFTLIASGFHWYPFTGRFLLFLGPAVFILIAAGVDEIRSKSAGGTAIIWITLAGLLFIPRISDAMYHLRHPTKKEEIRPAINYLIKHKRDGDVLYVYPYAYPSFKYYYSKYGFHDSDYVVGVWSTKNWGNYLADLDRVRGHRRVWVLFSHVQFGHGVNEEKLYVYHLDRIGTKLDSFHSFGAAVYLYDLTRPVKEE